MNDLERRRLQMEKERWELLNKISHLADEVRFVVITIYHVFLNLLHRWCLKSALALLSSAYS